MEDLFYNVQTRKNALKSAFEEHNRVVEVVTRFAVHNASVGFSLKKLNDNGADVSPNSSHVDNIRVLYGNTVAKDLIQLQVEDAHLKIKGMCTKSLKIYFLTLYYFILIFVVNGWISSLEYPGTKVTMLFFINNRLVDSSQLKVKELIYSYVL